MTERGKNQGEGDREAARHYEEKTRKFVDSGKVEEAAKRAAPGSEQEQHELEQAEQSGKRHAKEDDPEIKRNYKKPS